MYLSSGFSALRKAASQGAVGSLLETLEDRKLWEMLGWWVVSVCCLVAREIQPASTQYLEVSVDILASLGAGSRLPDCNPVSFLPFSVFGAPVCHGPDTLELGYQGSRERLLWGRASACRRGTWLGPAPRLLPQRGPQPGRRRGRQPGVAGTDSGLEGRPQG